jgi:hypothetical protein
MAGLNVGMSNIGSFRGSPEMRFNKPKSPAAETPSASPSPGIDTAPSQPPPRWSKLGGMLANSDALPSAMDPFRSYGTVSDGKVIPPSNPYGPPPGFSTSGGAGTWEGGGPGPSPNFTPPSPAMTPPQGPNPWLERGGFTGGQLPPDVQSDSSGASTGFWNPQAPKLDPTTGQYQVPIPSNPGLEYEPGIVGPTTPPGLRIPRRNPYSPSMPQGNPMANRGFRGAYGAGAPQPNRPFQNNLFY